MLHCERQQPNRKKRNMKYDQLMQAYEKAAEAFHKAKTMTQAASKAGKRMEKAIEALEQYRANSPEASA